jgi:hypothetical protein
VRHAPEQAKTTPELQALKRRMTRLEARMKERPSLKEAPSVMIESLLLGATRGARPPSLGSMNSFRPSMKQRISTVGSIEKPQSAPR